MAYDEGLAQRIREILGERPDLEEKKMFGGVSFLLNGNVSVGVIKEDLLVRVGEEKYEEAVGLAHARPFDFSGKTSKGWIFVSAGGYDEDEALKDWVQRGVDFASSLPPK